MPRIRFRLHRFATGHVERVLTVDRLTEGQWFDALIRDALRWGLPIHQRGPVLAHRQAAAALAPVFPVPQDADAVASLLDRVAAL